MSGGFDKEINNNIKGKNEDQDDQFIMKSGNHEIDSKSPVGRLYQAPEVVNERQNKIYWTDEELGLDSRVPDENADAKQQVQDFDSLKIDESSKEGKILQNPDDYDQQVFFSKVPKDTSNENEVSIQRQAQDRQLVVSVTAAADFSQGNIEDKFQEIVFTLPNLIDQTKDFIVEDIASKNMLGYTIAGSYFVGAFLDTIGELLITGRFIRDVIVKKEFLFLMGWLWWYALGFSGPWLFPAIFSGGNPYLACSSDDYFSILAVNDLSLNINTITNRPQGEMAILSEKLRVDFRDELGCIVHKQGDYKEARHVQTQFNKMLRLINLHYQLSSPVPGPADLLALDQELASIWVQIPLLVEEAHADVTSRRAYTAAIYFLIGLFNVFGAVNGAMIFVVRKSDNLVGEDIEPVINQTTDVPPGVPPLMAEVSVNLGGEDIELVINQPTDVPTPMEEVPIKHLLIGNALIGLGQGFGWGYGYYMTYFLFMEEADPGCGLVDMDDVYSRYGSFCLLDTPG